MVFEVEKMVKTNKKGRQERIQMRRKYKSMLGSDESNQENIQKLKQFFSSSVLDNPSEQISPSKLHIRSSSLGLESLAKIKSS